MSCLGDMTSFTTQPASELILATKFINPAIINIAETDNSWKFLLLNIRPTGNVWRKFLPLMNIHKTQTIQTKYRAILLESH